MPQPPRAQVIIGPKLAITLAAIAVVAVAAAVLVELDRGDTDADEPSLRVRGPVEAPLPDRPRKRAAPRVVRPRDPDPPARPARPGKPAPDQVYAVGVDDAPVRGSDSALVTIVKVVDYACPYCERSRATVDQIERIYQDDVRVVMRNMVVHPTTATVPARAGCAAHRQGRFWDMDELLWERAFKARRYDRDHMLELADELGLDVDLFRADLDGPCPAEIERDMADLRRFGVSGTPSFFVNGRFLSGARPLADFTELIEEELARARQRVAGGTQRSDYYRSWVMARGRQGV